MAETLYNKGLSHLPFLLLCVRCCVVCLIPCTNRAQFSQKSVEVSLFWRESGMPL